MPEQFKCGYVSIIGRPNVGKSTLLNKILGQKISITSKKPQTTRWQLSGIKTEADYQIIYVDTPGLQSKYKSAINRHMRREIMNSLSRVNVLIFVIEALVWTDTEDQILKIISDIKCPVILVINKIDKLKSKVKLLPFIDSISGKNSFLEILPVSALKGNHVEQIEAKVLQLIPLAPPEFPEHQLTDRNERFFAAEFIREKLTRILGEELPYKISVTIDEFSDEEPILHILASIWVETENQKKIVIGKNGKNLKYVGKYSRIDMEHMFGKKIFLQTWVKVRKKWSEDEKALKQFGYEC